MPGSSPGMTIFPYVFNAPHAATAPPHVFSTFQNGTTSGTGTNPRMFER
jgi:hypothetical protein